jgi:hypothetical protein
MPHPFGAQVVYAAEGALPCHVLAYVEANPRASFLAVLSSRGNTPLGRKHAETARCVVGSLQWSRHDATSLSFIAPGLAGPFTFPTTAATSEPSSDSGTYIRCTEFREPMHLFASEAINAGVDVYTLADLLSHEDPALTLRRYVHRVSEALDKARKAIGQRYRLAA